MEITRLPELSGDSEQSLREIKSYIVRLDRQLSLLLDNVGSENLAPELESRISVQSESIGSLKNEIIETATEIKAVSDRIDLRLESDYVAKSELGQYTEQAFQEITVDGKGITQYFEELSGISERVDGASADALGAMKECERLDAGLTKINAYIRSGKLEDGVYGLEIGNFSSTSTAPYKVRLSENRLSFFVFDEEVAYFSDNYMHINRASVPMMLTVGGCRMINDNGLAFACE